MVRPVATRLIATASHVHEAIVVASWTITSSNVPTRDRDHHLTSSTGQHHHGPGTVTDGAVLRGRCLVFLAWPRYSITPSSPKGGGGDRLQPLRAGQVFTTGPGLP